MATTPKKPKIIVIVGPTGSGKSALAMWLAQKYKGEIIAADSRTVYRGMDIGTAKPSHADQQLVPHWGLDLVNPGERFTAYQFKNYVLDKVADIRGRGKLPILVGGTGLYIDSFLFDFGFREDANLKLREELQELSIQQLQKTIEQQGYTMPANSQNKRHLVRAVEAKGRKDSNSQNMPDGTLIIGLLPPDDVLKHNISKRAEAIFQKGLIDETKQLLKTYDRKVISSGGIAYQVCVELVGKKINESEAKDLIRTKEWQYARRQRTWFKRNPHIIWFTNAQAAKKALPKLLNT